MTFSSYRNPGSSQTINYQSDKDPSLPPGIPAESNALCFRSDVPSLYAHSGPLDTDWTLVGGGGASDSAFALLNYDWNSPTILGQKNISSVTILGIGVRQFAFTEPLTPFEPGKVIITLSSQPVINDGQISPPIQVYGEIIDANTIRIIAYPTQSLIPGNAVDPTDELEKVYMRIDVVPVDTH